MIRSSTALLAALLPGFVLAGDPVGAQEVVAFEPGMVVTESVRIAPGTYEVAGTTLEEPLVTVRGSGVTLDLTGVELRGMPVEADPDRARGLAVFVDGGRDVAVRGGRVRGYRFGLLARGTRGLTLEGIDLSHTWKPRLFSRVGQESLVDWMSFHRNEDREWMRWGGAIYLEDVTGGAVRGVRAVQGMNGLLMVRTDSVRVEDSELAYNSALGIGMYRASHNVIVRNRLDYNVRGYSHGFYNRGQDSAGILLYEQSSGNVIAYNSATHGGDGLFLWAGQSTMETGEGGANDNLVFHNDFSWAPTNGIEVTFSRNRLIGNLLAGNRYGVWGGYSWETEILGNCFRDNATGIAIEHGQDNRVARNRFERDDTAVALWANPSEPEGWGYPRHRDTRSRDHTVRGNVFSGHGLLWKLQRTLGLDVGENRVLGAPPEEPCDPRALLGPAFDSLAPDLPGVPRSIPPAERAGLDRSAIVVDAWGPFDGRSPKLWPADTTRAVVPLRVLGPEGRWWVTGREGVAGVSEQEGRTGDTLVVRPAPGRTGDWSVSLAYVGAGTVSPRGVRTPAGDTVAFGFERFEPEMAWDVRVHRWDDPETAPPEAPGRLEEVLAGQPLLRRAEDRLDYQWYGPRAVGFPTGAWVAEATTTVDLGPGEHTLRTISDDGVRAWVDGELVIDRWEPHGSMVDHAPLEGPGRREIRVRYYQLGGWAELRVEVVRGRERSTGTAGPF